MRSSGTLTKWNEQRGFGFISVAGEARELFVHVSAFEQRGVRPRVDDILSFERETRPDGREHAVRVRPYGQTPHRRHASAPRGNFSPVAGALFALALIGFGWWLFDSRAEHAAPASAAPAASVRAIPQAQYRCDGRTMCSQMTSCAEARFFLQSCPNTEMDGDGDGIPCEQQWCSR